jgi:hypothetical protein
MQGNLIKWSNKHHGEFNGYDVIFVIDLKVILGINTNSIDK